LEETHKYLVYANSEKVAQISTTQVGDAISEPETVYFLGDALDANPKPRSSE